MSDIGRIGESFGGLEEAWSARARLAAIEARRRKSHGGLSNDEAVVKGLDSVLTKHFGMPSPVDTSHLGRPRTDAELFPGEAAAQARRAAMRSGHSKVPRQDLIKDYGHAVSVRDDKRATELEDKLVAHVAGKSDHDLRQIPEEDKGTIYQALKTHANRTGNSAHQVRFARVALGATR